MTGVIIVVIATMITRNKNKQFLKALYTSIIGLTALYKHLLKQCTIYSDLNSTNTTHNTINMRERAREREREDNNSNTKTVLEKLGTQTCALKQQSTRKYL